MFRLLTYYPDYKWNDVKNESKDNQTDFKISPNPVNDKAKIVYYSRQPGNVTMTIQNILGEIVYTKISEISDPQKVSDTYKVSETSGSETSITISTKDFPPGIYFLTVKSGSYTGTKKFVVLK